MKPFADYIKRIHKAQHAAKKYAEKYIMCKAESNMTRAKAYHDMAMQCLEHADKIYQFEVEDMKKLKETMVPTQDMEDMVSEGHKDYVHRNVKIKEMLNM